MPAIRIVSFILAGSVLLAQQAPGSASAATGDTARGKAIFEGKGGCMKCHRIHGNGSRFGPDLSDIGGSREPPQLETSILDPNAEISAQNRIYRVVTKDGTAIVGRLLNEDTFTVQMIDQKERLLSFQRSDLREAAFVEKSPMPSFRNRLSAQELADVVSYLSSLKPPPGTNGSGRGRGGAPPR